MDPMLAIGGREKQHGVLVYMEDVYVYNGLTVGLGTQKMYKMAYHG